MKKKTTALAVRRDILVDKERVVPVCTKCLIPMREQMVSKSYVRGELSVTTGKKTQTSHYSKGIINKQYKCDTCGRVVTQERDLTPSFEKGVSER